jgi:hypothetical protein
MIPRDASPIGHISPRPPIEIQRRAPVSGKVLPISRSILEMMEDNRLWELVVEAAKT